MMLANMKGTKSAASASPAQPADAGEKEWVNPFADLDDSRVQVPSAGRKMKDISESRVFASHPENTATKLRWPKVRTVLRFGSLRR